jgi:response regulator RpfG family c-di-GMP phosphodiesterase
MDGLELLKNTSRSHPDVVCVVMSGVAQYDEACAMVNRGGAYRLLTKPLHIGVLRETIEDALRVRQERAGQAARLLGLAYENRQLRQSSRALSTRADARWRSRRVALYARRLGEALGLSEGEVKEHEYAALLQAHERWDGMGYPLGLRGDEILVRARVFAVVDCYDAMSSSRSYEVARAEIERRSGAQLDPLVVTAFCSLAPGIWQEISDAVQREQDQAVA